MKNVPWWVFALAGGAAFLYFKKQAILNAPGDAGRALSRSLFDVLNPSLSKEAFNKPTIVDARPNGKGGFTCPFGYTLKYGQSRGWYCLISDGTKTDPQSKLPVAIGIPTGKNG